MARFTRSPSGSIDAITNWPESGDHGTTGWLLSPDHEVARFRVSATYGETGAEEGGAFKPHKTHQNGLAVDFMVPVLFEGASVPLPGGAFNRYGYDIEFDNKGNFEEYSIDFEALGELIYQLDRAARENKIGISRIIFEVPLQKLLWKSARGAYLKKNVVFSTKQAWVRHDEHIHVDFAVKCARM